MENFSDILNDHFSAMLLRLALLLLGIRSVLSRGRYEFIDDADLPAFYR